MVFEAILNNARCASALHISEGVFPIVDSLCSGDVDGVVSYVHNTCTEYTCPMENLPKVTMT